MSIEAFNWANKIFQTLDIPSSDRIVLLGLCFRHNKKTGGCYPSVETLCEFTGCSESTVRRSLKKLNKWGLISIKTRTKNGRQTSNQYFLFGVPKVPEKVGRGVSLKPPHRGVTGTPLKMSSMTPNKEGIYNTSEAECGKVVKFPSQKKGFGDV